MRLPEPAPHAAPAGVRVDAHEGLTLATGWRAAACAPDSQLDPAHLDGLDWLPARVPGTAAAALYDAGRWRPGDGSNLDAEDWWFSTRFDAPASGEHEQVTLELDGLATLAEVFLNGTRVLASESMFAPHSLDVGALLRGENELAIRFLALAPRLARPRKPRARWRTRLVEGNLRFFRTMLLGRAPGFAAEPAAVGPWRPVRLSRRRGVVVEELRLHPRLDGDEPGADGLLDVLARLRSLDGTPLEVVELELDGPSGAHRAALELAGDATGAEARGTLRIPRVACWWPRSHGEPVLHEVRLNVTTAATATTVRAPRTGFRALAAGAHAAHDVEADGLDLHVNGVRVFARGAVWTPIDAVGLAPGEPALRAALEHVRDAGMNMLRIPGTSAYESETFHGLCDELGILVWQDFMFANLDYPIGDEDFRASVLAEASTQLGLIAGRPSLAVLCGNSEVEQQVAMLGLDPALGRGELFGELLPRLVAEAPTDAVYVPSAPCGGSFPFRADRGVANYYGVGGYRRPLEDARRAEVRFAAECLAFSNVPDEAGVADVMPDAGGDVVVHHPRWKAGVPRDVGTGWDFEDVRDHYLQSLFGVDPSELRRVDHERYLELSRAVTGEAMADVFGEWRRPASPCGGGLVLWLSDLTPGAGWGVLDHFGRPKPAYHHLRRALAPVAVWMTDEGLGGYRAHVANDRPTPLRARLRVALYRHGENRIAEAHEELEVPAHGACERDVEALIGHFADASWAYRFGPPGHDVVVASLERPDADAAGPLAQAFRFPAGRPLRLQTGAELGLSGSLHECSDRTIAMTLCSRRLAYGVRVHVPNFTPSDDALTLEPGVRRTLSLTPHGGASECRPLEGSLSALNLHGRIKLAMGRTSAEQERGRIGQPAVRRGPNDAREPEA
jgi:beta-mannosidase